MTYGENLQNTIKTNEVVNNQIQENNSSKNLENQNTELSQEQNIGGANNEMLEETEKTEEPTSQMEQDAKDILASKSLIIPLKGTITSRFGVRDPKTPTVPKNHTGIDIAANEGTIFIASMSGTVEEVSNVRRFRKSF